MTVTPTVEQQTRPLVAVRVRPWALTLVVVALAVLGAMALWLHDTGDPTSFDSSVAGWLYGHVGHVGQQSLLALSDPALTVGIVVVVSLGALALRRWDVAVLAAVGPAVGFVVMHYVLKPSINRYFGEIALLSRGSIAPGPAFPSGHETGLMSVTVLLSLLVLRSGTSPRVKAGSVLLAAVWTVAGAAGLVRSGYHYATDTVGGVLLAFGVMVGTALLIDGLGPRALSSPAGRRLSRTPAGA